MLDPDSETAAPVPVVAMTRTYSYPEIEIISMARRETHRTRRMQILEDEAIDQTRTGEIPLCDWTPARTPSIDVAPRASTSAQALAAARRDYRRGIVMGAAIATVIAASLAATLALLA
jgi:hypothetical protein